MSEEKTTAEDSAAPLCYAFCALSDKARHEIKLQIDADEWKHSWHLPKSSYGGTDWNRLDTMEKVRDVLVDQITTAKARQQDAERCLKIVVDEMIEMEKRIEA